MLEFRLIPFQFIELSLAQVSAFITVACNAAAVATAVIMKRRQATTRTWVPWVGVTNSATAKA